MEYLITGYRKKQPEFFEILACSLHVFGSVCHYYIRLLYEVKMNIKLPKLLNF